VDDPDRQGPASARGWGSRVGSTDPRRRQATSLFSRADQTSVIKIAREGMAATSANAVKPPAAGES
jgi:hypothetical protein